MICCPQNLPVRFLMPAAFVSGKDGWGAERHVPVDKLALGALSEYLETIIDRKGWRSSAYWVGGCMNSIVI